jgi:hypothetical protein
MRSYRPFNVTAFLLITMQCLGPVGLWAAESQRGGKDVSRRITVTGLHGEASVGPPDTSRAGHLLRFRETSTTATLLRRVRAVSPRY